MDDQASGAGMGIGGFILWLVLLVIFTIAPMYLSYRTMVGKGNSGILGLVLGFFLSWIGFIITLVIPRRAV